MKYLVFSLFALSYFAFRLPSYPLKMEGEDGFFAAIILKQPQSPNFVLAGRLDGNDIWNSANHPAMTYELVKIPEKIIGPRNWKAWSPYWRTGWCRFYYSLYQFFFFAGLIGLILIFYPTRGKAFWQSILITEAFALSPLSIHSSTYLQLDGSAGALCLGLLALSLLFSLNRHGRSRSSPIFLFAASVFSGFGKNEWSVVVFLALFFTAAALAIFKAKRSCLFPLSIVLVGCCVGNLISWLYAPQSYTDGFLFFLTGGGGAGGTWSEKLARWAQFTRERITLIAFLMTSFIIGFLASEKEAKRNSYVVLLTFLSLGLFSMYFLSLAFPIPRFFTPALVTTCTAFVALRKHAWREQFSKILTIFLILSFAHSTLFVFHRFQETFKYHFVDADLLPQEPRGCVLLADGAAMLNDQDFVFKGAAAEGARKLVQKSTENRHRLCDK